MKTYTLDPDLLRFFGGQTGAVCPWPTRAEIQADLREFFGGIDPTPPSKGTWKRVSPGDRTPANSAKCLIHTCDERTCDHARI